MNLLIVYCGDFTWCPHNVEILGDLKMTDVQMSDIGKNLRPYQRGEENRLVFTNSENIITGLQVAVKRGHLRHEQVSFRFMVGEIVYPVAVDSDGNFSMYPVGFFSQKCHDLLELF
jgi:hypothetical protein